MKEKFTNSKATTIIGPEDGTRVLLLHGMTGSPTEMLTLANFLGEKGFKSYIPVLSGHCSNLRQFRLTRTRAWITDAHKAIDEVSSHGSRPCAVIGHSFGATLALYIVLTKLRLHKEKSEIKSLVLLSPTFVIRPRWASTLLKLASHLPERILDFLPLIPKRKTSSYCLVVPRTAYPVYSLGAGSRMFRIIRHIIPRLSSLKIKTLVLRDPNDHLSHQASLEILKGRCPASTLQIIEMEDAHHELLAGKHRQQAFDLIAGFIG